VSEGAVFDLMRAGIQVLMTVTGPFVVAALVVGILIAIFQAATQIQDAALAFVPKMIIVGVVMLLLGPVLLDSLTHYMTNTFQTMGKVGRGVGQIK
jgi:flagellar biosynthetic protein FliQ